MKEKMLALYQKYGEMLRYLVIGGLTTLIDIGGFALLHTVLGMHYQLANVLVWVLAVAFAFWGNKVIVFRSKSSEAKTLLREAASFVASRLFTLLFSAVFLYVTVDVLGWDGTLSKAISTVVVVVLNYVLSKLMVFRKG